MQKGTSNGDLKKNATPDDDFGKDFFDSWKSAKLGNDSIDFDVETVPKNKKASFKFDELDNFELSGNFDKLPSFKLDVPDLDLAGPSKKNEKTNEKSKEIVKGKQEQKDGKFSFDFDFNSFDLDSKSLEDKRPSIFSDKKAPEHSSKHEKNQESDQRSDFAHKTEASIGKRPHILENNEKRTCVNMTRREHSQGNYLTKENSDSSQYFCLQSFSGDGSAELVPQKTPTDSAPSDVVKPREIKKDDSMQPISSSPSMSSSPVDSYNSGCWTKAGENELPNPGTMLQNRGQGPPTIINGSLAGSIQNRKDANYSTGLMKSTGGVKIIDEKQHSCKNLIVPPEKQNSRQNVMLPPLKSDITFGGSAKLRGLMSNGLHLKTIRKLEDNIPQQLPALKSNPFNSTMEAKTKTAHASTKNESRTQEKQYWRTQEKQNSRQNVMLPSLKSDIALGGSAKLRGLMSIRKLEDNIPQQLPALKSNPFNSTMEARTKTAHASTKNESSSQFKRSSVTNQALIGSKSVAMPSLQKKPISDATINTKVSSDRNDPGSVKDKLISSDRLGSHIIETKKGAASGDNNHCGILDSAIAKTKEMNKNKPSEAKSVRFLEKRMECPLNVTSKTTNSANIGKKSPLLESLKRKIDEQSVADLETSSPLECVKVSNASQRISFEASPNTKRKMVPEIKIAETYKDLTAVTNQTSLTITPEMENIVAVASSFYVEDDNLRKAETLTKDLDNICNIVKKKHDEAKELQVRSIINNNALLLLNYHMLEEKIQMLQKFSSSLLLKEI